MKQVLCLAVALSVGASPAVAQGGFWGLDLNYAPFFERGCGTTYPIGAGASAGYAPSGIASITASVRGYVLSLGPAWVCDYASAPADGWIEDDVPYLSVTRFVTTDVRGRIHMGPTPRSWALAFGGGVVWRRGTDFPYALLGVRAPVFSHEGAVISLTGEFQLLRMSGNQYRYWFENAVPRSERLGPVSELRDVLRFSASLEFAR